MARKISASVGRLGGLNRYDDVVTVQELLNHVPPNDGGPSPLLKVDGKCGPKTINAIQKFQIKQIGWSGADGRVDPDGRTFTILDTFDKSGGSQPVPPSPPSLPKSNRFVIHRMDSKTTFVPHDRELFFQVVDMANGLIGIYWFKMQGRPMTFQQPPATFTGPSRSFITRQLHAINGLVCPTMYSSSQVSGRISSRMALFLPTGPVQIDNMPHHLIGPGGQVGPGRGDTNTSIAGTFEFVRQG